LPLEEFHKNQKCKYGRAAWCRLCFAAYKATPEEKAKQRIRDATPEAKAKRRTYQATPEAKAKAKIRKVMPAVKAKAKVYEATPEVRAKNKVRRATPEAKAKAKIRQATPEAKAKNKVRRATPEGKAAAKRQNFKRRSCFNIDPKLTADDWQKILELWNNRCMYCGAEGDLEQDHLWPVSKGGKDEAANVGPACQRCNSFKSAKLPHELPPRFQEAIKRHAELLGEADIPIIEQERLYAAF